jgi:hypothetical protein
MSKTENILLREEARTRIPLAGNGLCGMPGAKFGAEAPPGEQDPVVMIFLL